MSVPENPAPGNGDVQAGANLDFRTNFLACLIPVGGTDQREING
jgi:hypothetical protein